MKDRLVISGLTLEARIGVPDAERAAPQRLEIDLVLETAFRGLNDEIDRAVDYAAVSERVRTQVAASCCRLIETLAESLAAAVLRDFPRVTAIEVEVRKFILPGIRHVAAKIRRERS